MCGCESHMPANNPVIRQLLKYRMKLNRLHCCGNLRNVQQQPGMKGESTSTGLFLSSFFSFLFLFSGAGKDAKTQQEFHPKKCYERRHIGLVRESKKL